MIVPSAGNGVQAPAPATESRRNQTERMQQKPREVGGLLILTVMSVHILLLYIYIIYIYICIYIYIYMYIYICIYLLLGVFTYFYSYIPVSS